MTQDDYSQFSLFAFVLLEAAVRHFPYSPTFKGHHGIRLDRKTGALTLDIHVAELDQFFWCRFMPADFDGKTMDEVMQGVRKQMTDAGHFEAKKEQENPDPKPDELRTLKGAVRNYLAEPSMDGRRIRKQLREQLAALVNQSE